MAVLLAVLIAGAMTAGVFLAQVRASDAASSRRQAVVTAARAAVTDLTTADYRHPRRYVSRLRAVGTGTFLSLFTNSATGFTHVLIQGKVETAGHVAVVGVRRLSTDTAQRSMLAYVTVKNAQTHWRPAHLPDDRVDDLGRVALAGVERRRRPAQHRPRAFT